ncbi:hypothetical protein C5167_021522 [Papaver somniferum]|nr:hypothetical protein C5167_021522 [Papaver somniferum]
MMYYDDYDTTVPTTTRQITTNKHGVLKLLNCFDMDCETPCSFKFADDKIIESTPAKLAGIFCMQRIGSRKGQKLLKYYCPSDLTDNVLYSKYFTDIKSTKHQTTVTKTNILEKIKQLMAKRRKSGKRKKVDEKDLVSWPDLIHEHLFEEIHTNLSCLSNVKACVQYLLLLFAEHTPAGLIPKVENHEEDIPRVGRWDIYQISDYIWKTDMTQFSVSVICQLV